MDKTVPLLMEIFIEMFTSDVYCHKFTEVIFVCKLAAVAELLTMLLHIKWCKINILIYLIIQKGAAYDSKC